jgi:diguanylate cyclase (GGDEF)-like protein
VARSLGWFFVVAPMAAELWLMLEPSKPVRAHSLLLTCILAQVVGLLFHRGFADSAPPAVLKLLLACGSILVTALSVLSGTTDNGFAYLYVWVAPYAFFFGVRHAIAQGVFAALMLAYTYALLDADPLGAVNPDDWILPVGTVLVVGGFVHRLTSELGRTDRERLRSERVRAELEAGRAASERERARREAAMSRLGRVALRAPDRGALLPDAIVVLADTLPGDHVEILELVDAGAGVRLAGSTGRPAGDGGELSAEDRLLAGWALAADGPAVVWEWAAERRLDVPGLHARGIRSTVAAGIRGRHGAFGIIAVHSASVGAYSVEDGHWLQSFGDLLAAALDRDRSETLIRHQSMHDALTGLPNRTLFADRLEHAFARAERDGAHVAVLLLDVDQFKTINDSLGHEAGDDLLVALSARLQQVTRGSDTVARLGGDEFALVCEVESQDEAFAIAERIADAWEQPIAVRAGGELFVSASIGIALASGRSSADQMLREADAAMYRAKDGGRGRFELFDEEMRRDAFERLRTESELRRAVERKQFRVLYQPIFDVADGRLTGFEALVRWRRPGVDALVEPREFIGLAEETGLIAPLGRWVLQQATMDLVAWRRRHPAAGDVRLTVNVSGRQLARPEFLEEVRTALAQSGLPPASLGLEITESVLFKDAASPRPTLEALRAMGVRVLLDDFGTGYSSLSRLKGFPVDAIKVDRSFVQSLGPVEEDTTIVGAIIEIARSLGLEAIAEGVERPDQLARLRELGCTAAQGHLLAPPAPVLELDGAPAFAGAAVALRPGREREPVEA